MKCPNCGKEIANDSQFCEFCGTQLVSAKKGAQEASVHVRWLLFVSTLLLYLFNVFAFDEVFLDGASDGMYSHYDTSTLWIASAVSLIFFIIGLILFVKKKLKGIYTIMLFMIFGINTAIPITAETCKWSSTAYYVSISLYENGIFVGCVADSYQNDINGAQKVEQVFTNMVNSASRKYSGSEVQIDERRDYSDSALDIEDITNIYWSTEGLIMLIYLIIASVASKREKKKNA